MKAIFFSIGLLFLAVVHSESAMAQVEVDVESGIVFPGYNDVRIPGDQGTHFSLNDDLKSDNSFFYRIRLNYIFNLRHRISVLYAPLKTHSEGSMAQDIYFEDVVFSANTDLEGTYKFNSYRLTYRYDIVKNPGFEFGLGITAKIRDAKITISSSESVSEKSNVGFVPLINFMLLWNINDQFGLLLDGDALAAPQGRAEDVLVAATYRLSDNVGIRAGYRILEGGADNDEVYNFSLFNYASVGITYTFNGTKR